MLFVTGLQWEMRGPQRGRAIGEPLSEADRGRQRVDHVVEARLVLVHQREDLGRGEPLSGRVVSHRRGELLHSGGVGRLLDDYVPQSRGSLWGSLWGSLGGSRAGGRGWCAGRAGGALVGLGVALDREAAATVSLAVQHQPRAGRITPDQPGLVEEGDAQRAARVGDGRLDQRPHAATAHGARGDLLDLDHHRGGLSDHQIGDRAGLAAVARKVLQQIPNRRQTERFRALYGLRAIELQRPPQTLGKRPADRRGKQLVGV